MKAKREKTKGNKEVLQSWINFASIEANHSYIISRQSHTIMANRGQLFLIVGNAGSGKDSLLKEVKQRWPASAKPIRITQRTISRPPHDSEPYISVTPEAFDDLKRQNKFLLTWFIYGTHYGIPITILEWIEQGEHVVANVSRSIIPQARKIMPDLKVIFISVPLEITLKRVRSRAREPENDPAFQERLQRAKENQTLKEADLTIENTGSLEAAIARLLNYLLSFD